MTSDEIHAQQNVDLYKKNDIFILLFYFRYLTNLQQPMATLCSHRLSALFTLSTLSTLFFLLLRGRKMLSGKKKESNKPAQCVSELDLFEPAVKPDSTTANRKAEHLCRKTNTEGDETDFSTSEVTLSPQQVSGELCTSVSLSLCVCVHWWGGNILSAFLVNLCLLSGFILPEN